jgi:hypothetical protein
MSVFVVGISFLAGGKTDETTSGEIGVGLPLFSQKPFFPHRQCTPNPFFLKTENAFFGTGA